MVIDPAALDALRTAARKYKMTRGQVRAACQAATGESKFTELTELQQWGLVCAIDPSATGPYGQSMEPFDDG